MILADYISDLLYRYNCVIVPELGGFITNTISAQIDGNTHTFYAPTKQISFNSHLKHNDGLLANYIAKTENISFEKATENILNTVALWQQQMQSKSVTISSVGNLFLNSEKQIVFEPNNQVNFLTESFGLASFSSLAINRETVVDIQTKTENKKVIPLFIKYAATAAILLTLGVAGWKGYQYNQQQQVLAKQQHIEKKIQSATFVIDNPLPTINLNVAKETETPKKYAIIAGAFQFAENANKKARQLTNKGYNAIVLDKNKWGLFPVAFNCYENKAEALKQLRIIKQTTSKDAWLFVNQQK
ncbi:SPOR domain-containing protein [Tenacibaculum sp. UWU-22]|uniref:HU domain-containing protein n=1 Tax=Tenacibaculum sp. UWU-22 TaxID=3234187 RepID=UPI0034DAE5DC